MSDTLKYMVAHLGHAMVLGAAAVVVRQLCSHYDSRLSILRRCHSMSRPALRRVSNTVVYSHAGHLISLLMALVFRLAQTVPSIPASPSLVGDLGCSFSHLMLLSVSAYVCQISTPPHTKNQINVKLLAWFVHSATLGVALSPLLRQSTAHVVQILVVHTGLMCGLTTLAMTIPHDKHKRLRKFAFGSLLCLLCFSTTRRFVSPNSALYPTLYVVDIYGGMLQFSFNYVLDFQAFVHRATADEVEAPSKYDAVSSSLRLIINSTHLLMRVSSILVPKLLASSSSAGAISSTALTTLGTTAVARPLGAAAVRKAAPPLRFPPPWIETNGRITSRPTVSSTGSSSSSTTYSNRSSNVNLSDLILSPLRLMLLLYS